VAGAVEAPDLCNGGREDVRALFCRYPNDPSLASMSSSLESPSIPFFPAIWTRNRNCGKAKLIGATIVHRYNEKEDQILETLSSYDNNSMKMVSKCHPL
jgi:hypothetical protein